MFVPNVGTADRVARLMVAVLLAFLALSGFVAGALAVVVWVVAAVIAISALLGTCPLYSLAGFSTRRGAAVPH
jgi:hypothetical protein